MDIIRPADTEEEKAFPFDGPWRTAVLRLHENEWAQYTVYDVTTSCRLEIECTADVPSRLEIHQNGISLGIFDLSGCRGTQLLSGMHLYTTEQCELRLTVLSGCACVKRLLIQPAS